MAKGNREKYKKKYNNNVQSNEIKTKTPKQATYFHHDSRIKPQKLFHQIKSHQAPGSPTATPDLITLTMVGQQNKFIKKTLTYM